MSGRPWGMLGLGGSAWSIRSVLDQQQVTDVVRAAVDSGIRLFDTARAYTTVDESAHNEQLLGEALRALGATDAVIIDKGGHFRIDADSWGIDGRPAALHADCRASLAALGRERIDVYLLHHPDPDVPIEESVGALDELRRDGLVGEIGVSNVDVALLARATAAGPITVVENRYSPFHRTDTTMIAACEAAGISYAAYSSLGGRRRPADLPTRFPLTFAVAARHGVSAYSVWLAWIRRSSIAVTPLIGATRPESVRDSGRQADALLDETEWADVDAEIAALD